MSGPAKSKVELANARVYIHKQDTSTRSRAIHIDVEHPDLNEIIKPSKHGAFLRCRNRQRFRTDENTFCGGKDGGVFLGLKREMQTRAKDYVEQEGGSA